MANIVSNCWYLELSYGISTTWWTSSYWITPNHWTSMGKNYCSSLCFGDFRLFILCLSTSNLNPHIPLPTMCWIYHHIDDFLLMWWYWLKTLSARWWAYLIKINHQIKSKVLLNITHHFRIKKHHIKHLFLI